MKPKKPDTVERELHFNKKSTALFGTLHAHGYSIKQIQEKKQLIQEKENKRKEKTRERLKILFDFVFPYLMFLICNISNPSLWGLKISFFHEMPFILALDIVIKTFLYEILIIIALSLLLKGIFKKSLMKNIGLGILFETISIISFYKMQVVQKPFLPEDLFLMGEGLKIAEYGNLKIVPILLVQVFLSLILIIIQAVVTHRTQYEAKKISKWSRIKKLILAIVILFVTCFINWETWLASYNLDPRMDYYRYGGVINFFRNMYVLAQTPKLSIYSEENIEQIKKQVEQEPKQDLSDQVQPNIIVIMSESFSDPTKLKGVTFNQDPIPTYRKLAKDYVSGNAIVDIYGGETCMSEFEFLTVSTGRFLNGEKYPYSQIVKQDTNSITRVLKRTRV